MPKALRRSGAAFERAKTKVKRQGGVVPPHSKALRACTWHFARFPIADSVYAVA